MYIYNFPNVMKCL